MLVGISIVLSEFSLPYIKKVSKAKSYKNIEDMKNNYLHINYIYVYKYAFITFYPKENNLFKNRWNISPN